MVRCLYPGSFDPWTHGHLDLLRRAGVLFEDVCVGVGGNPDKRGLLDRETRVELIRQVIQAERLPARVVAFDGLLAEFARKEGFGCILRGVRNATDLGYEQSMAAANRRQWDGLDTVCLFPSPEWSQISSRLVREIALQGGDVTGLVPELVARRLKERRSS